MKVLTLLTVHHILGKTFSFKSAPTLRGHAFVVYCNDDTVTPMPMREYKGVLPNSMDPVVSLVPTLSLAAVTPIDF